MSCVLAVGLVLLGCASTEAQETRRASGPVPTAPGEPPTSTIVEFEPPEGFNARSPDGGFLQQAAQVGFFDKNLDLIRTVRIPREQMQLEGRIVRVTVPLVPIADVTAPVSLRVRMLGTGRPGAWSQEVGPVDLPPAPARAAATPRRTRAATGAAGARRQADAGQTLARRPALEAALSEHLTAEFSSAQALQAFPKVGDLATAIMLVRAHGVSLQALGQKVLGPPSKNLAAAFEELQPKGDAVAAIRAARKDARPLLAPQPRRRGAAQN